MLVIFQFIGLVFLYRLSKGRISFFSLGFIILREVDIGVIVVVVEEGEELKFRVEGFYQKKGYMGQFLYNFGFFFIFQDVNGLVDFRDVVFVLVVLDGNRSLEELICLVFEVSELGGYDVCVYFFFLEVCVCVFFNSFQIVFGVYFSVIVFELQSFSVFTLKQSWDQEESRSYEVYNFVERNQGIGRVCVLYFWKRKSLCEVDLRGRVGLWYEETV